MQYIGNITTYPFIGLIISTLFFAILHGSNPEIHEFGFLKMMIYYLSAGLFLGVITILDDSLELALGVHFATNFFGATMLNYTGSAIQTDSLFKVSSLNVDAMILAFFVCALIFGLISGYIFKWKNISTIWTKTNIENDILADNNPLFSNVSSTGLTQDIVDYNLKQ